jgi:ketosteroid isomerase-like protein
MKRSIVGFLCAVGLAATAAAASPNDAISAPITQFIDAFNKGDAVTAAAAHVANDLVIIDEVRPFSWQGPNAFTAWNDDLASDAEEKGITDQLVTLGETTRVESTADRAYVVVPAVYTYKQKGVAMREAAQMTFALRKEAAGWRISGWTWTGPTPERAP